MPKQTIAESSGLRKAAPVGGAKPTNVRRSSTTIAAGTMLSRVLGFFKGALIAVALGTTQGGGLSDIFELANSLPNLIYIMLAGGVFNVVLVPQIIKASKLPDRGADYLSRLLTLGMTVLLGIAVVFTLIAAPLLQLLTRDWQPEQLALGAQLAYLLVPQIFFYGVYALLGQMLNANDRFGLYAWAPVLNNLVAIAGIAAFLVIWGSSTENAHNIGNWTSAQTWLLAGSTTLGVVLQSLILILPVKRLGLALRPKWQWRGMGLGRTGRIAGWALGTMVISQLSYTLVNWVGSAATASKDAVGANQNIAGTFVFNRASDIYILPHSVIVLSVATIFFNRLSRSAADQDLPALRSTTSRLLRIVGVATVFFGFVLLVLSAPIGMLLSGNSPQAGLTMGIAVAILALAGPAFSFGFILNRVFYATEDSRTPFFLQIVAMCLTIIGSFAVSFVPVSMLTFALLGMSSAVILVSPVISAWMLRRKVGDFELRRVIRSYVQYTVAAIFSAVIGGLLIIAFGGLSALNGSFSGFLWRGYGQAILVIAVIGSVMAVCYFLTLKLMNVQELNELLLPLTTRISRRFPGSGTMNRLGSEAGTAAGARLSAHDPAEEETLSHSMEIGTVLGGRYKVTAHVLESAEGDQVLDGVDQVLSRPVSIVVAGRENQDHLAQGAREVATGDRAASFQILDLGLGEGTAYLIASKSNAADLLDLLVPTAPYVEPQFTDTLGEELFGAIRPSQSEQAAYVYDDDGSPVVMPANPAAVPPPPSVAPRSTAGSSPTASQPSVPNQARTASTPKVSLWSDEDYGFINEKPTAALGNQTSVPATVDPARGPGQRKASTFPSAAVASAAMPEEAEYDDDAANAPKSGRWLIGGVLVVILVVALAIAGTQLVGQWFGNNPAANTPGSSQTTPGSDASNDQSPTAPTVPPVIAGVTQLVPGVVNASNFPETGLSNLTDGNPATLWQTYEFTDDTFAAQARSLALVFQLRANSDISSVSITQSGATGGSFDLLVNDKPSLDGATSIGTGSFNGPETTVAAPPNTKASFVIVNFTRLPKLQAPRFYPYGLKIGEISIK